MASQLEIQKRNLESSILFMQQDHANTLRGLHDEITKLQKKCSELTFQLAMRATSDDVELDASKYAKVEEALLESELRRKNAELEAESGRRATQRALEQLRIQEKQFVDDMKAKNVRVVALTAELDAKGGTIAYLTTELHKLRAAKHGHTVTTSGEPKLFVSAPDMEPVPPETPRHKVIPHLRQRPPSSSDGTRRRPTSGQRLIAVGQTEVITSSGAQLVPDPAPFLATHNEVTREVALKPTPPVLPPISARHSGQGAALAVAAPVPQRGSQALISRRQVRGPHPDVSTGSSAGVSILAVGQISPPGQSYLKEPGSADCN